MANINWRRIIKRKLFIILAVIIVFSYGNVWANDLLAPPIITSFTPTQGGTDTAVTITGEIFTDATVVQFGGTNAASFNVDSATQITAVVGSGSTGTVKVTAAGGTGTSRTIPK